MSLIKLQTSKVDIQNNTSMDKVTSYSYWISNNLRSIHNITYFMVLNSPSKSMIIHSIFQGEWYQDIDDQEEA